MSRVIHKIGAVGAVLTAAMFFVVCLARYADAQGKPGSSVIELCPPRRHLHSDILQ
jgi:hypothetical protein